MIAAAKTLATTYKFKMMNLVQLHAVASKTVKTGGVVSISPENYGTIHLTGLYTGPLDL